MPLARVVRATDIADYDALLVLMEYTCYTEDARSLKEKLIKRASHCHLLFKVGKATVHCVLKDATKSTVYCASIKPFQSKKDGRNAWLSIVKKIPEITNGNDNWICQNDASTSRFGKATLTINLPIVSQNIGIAMFQWFNV